LSVPISGGSYRHFGFLDAIGVFVNKDNPLEKISFATRQGSQNVIGRPGGGRRARGAVQAGSSRRQEARRAGNISFLCSSLAWPRPLACGVLFRPR
jgi:hypothetical protein